MILGASEYNITQGKRDDNTEEFFSIINNRNLSEEQTARLFHLIQDGINVNDRDKYGWTPLLMSVRHSNDVLVQRLIQLGADLNIKVFDSTALHEAAWRGNCEIVRLLINAGANIDAQNHCGKTPLHQVTELRKTEMVELLLSYGANKEIKDNKGRTALHLAGICRFTDGIRLLLNDKAEINAIDNQGNTPLHYSILDFTKHAKLLLDHGADSTIKNHDGNTPLQVTFNKTFLINFEPPWLRARLEHFFKKVLLVYIMKFIEADDWRFEHLREMSGESFSSVKTADDMVAQILTEPKEQINVIVEIIDKLYPNAVKMTPPTLITRLLGAIEYPPIQECAASSSAAEDCIDDEQPPVTMITSAKKRNNRDNDIEVDENEENTKRCRT